MRQDIHIDNVFDFTAHCSITTQTSKPETLDSIIRKHGYLKGPSQARQSYPCPRPYRYAAPFCRNDER